MFSYLSGTNIFLKDRAKTSCSWEVMVSPESARSGKVFVMVSPPRQLFLLGVYVVSRHLSYLKDRGLNSGADSLSGTSEEDKGWRYQIAQDRSVVQQQPLRLGELRSTQPGWFVLLWRLLGSLRAC